MFGLFKKASTQDRLKQIAQGKRKARIEDFAVDTAEIRSLIHYAAACNNLPLFKECIRQGQSHSLKDFWKETPLRYAFLNHAYGILNYLREEYQLNLFAAEDVYGYPLWWEGLSNQQKSEEALVEMIRYVKPHVNFSGRSNGIIKESLGYKLLSSYRFRNLRILFENTVYDVNAPVRADHAISLAHAAIWGMEDARFHAFTRSDVNMQMVYRHIFRHADLQQRDQHGKTVVDNLCYFNRKELLKIAQSYHQISLNSEQVFTLQFMYQNRHQMTYAKMWDESQTEDFLFYPVMDKLEGMIACRAYPLVKGMDDAEIQATDCLSLGQLKKMQKVTLNNGYEFFK